MQENLFDRASGTLKGKRVFTVSEITRDIKLILENTFNEVWVEGEISGIRQIPSGTVFFTLKDSGSLLKCVIFSSFVRGVNFELKDGIKIVCFGRIGVYEKDGQYQLYTEKIEVKGLGSLQLALEQLKEKLEKEGLFASAHKRPIPYLPGRIGIVTSLQGAAIKDMLKVMDRRFADVNVIINPAQVQGEAAKGDIARAINEFNSFNDDLPPQEKIEVLIVGRGGGSIEDLWAFNEEVVARAIYNSRIPVISAVGHERDFTIADLVADLRAATPSVAAELVLPEKEVLEEKTRQLAQRLKLFISELIVNSEEELDRLLRRISLGISNLFKLDFGRFQSAEKKLALLSPLVGIQQHISRLSDLTRQLSIGAGHFTQLKNSRLVTLAEKLSSLSPLNILGRGYSITFKMPQREVIKDPQAIKAGDTIMTRMSKAEILSKVTEVDRNG
ncbi:MAG: exodeoxyribonuclease VII large subunit [Candidatus Omnitrophica bacterium]|nr:exodeoxyribonuclease VII large subunit [Candidatus Omnitrophota bacterium]